MNKRGRRRDHFVQLVFSHSLLSRNREVDGVALLTSSQRDYLGIGPIRRGGIVQGRLRDGAGSGRSAATKTFPHWCGGQIDADYKPRV